MSWAVTPAERLRQRCITDAICISLFGIDLDEAAYLLGVHDKSSDPKGFWRVDKEQDPELRHPLLSYVAFHDLNERIKASRTSERGIQGFLSQNDGNGWQLPEAVRLADYGIADDGAGPRQVAARLGPRYHEWQLEQSAEESWRECRMHARNTASVDTDPMGFEDGGASAIQPLVRADR
jgi:hypothetical protein